MLFGRSYVDQITARDLRSTRKIVPLPRPKEEGWSIGGPTSGPVFFFILSLPPLSALSPSLPAGFFFPFGRPCFLRSLLFPPGCHSSSLRCDGPPLPLPRIAADR